MKNKLVTALLSLVIAFGLWMYVVSVVAPDSERTYYDVPVKLHGSDILESRGLMLLSSQDLRLDLELSGTRTDLNQLTSSNITVIADLSSVNSAGEHTIFYSVSYPGSIASGITILSPEKQTITVVVAQWAKKEVPIEVEYTGELPADYTTDKKNVVLSRNSVVVSGVKEVVDRIEKATITIDLDGQTSDIDQIYELSFRDANGHAVDLINTTADAEHVTAVLKIDMIKTIDIKLDVIPGGGLEVKDSVCVPSFDQLVVSGPASILEDLNEITFTIDLADVDVSQILLFNIKLPDGVTNVTGISQLAVDVTLPAMVQRTLNIPKARFQLINVPDGLNVDVVTQAINVTVRGRQNRLAVLQPEDIVIIVDLADASPDKEQYNVTVQIAGAQDVEVISTYTVKVSVTPESAGPEE